MPLIVKAHETMKKPPMNDTHGVPWWKKPHQFGQTARWDAAFEKTFAGVGGIIGGLWVKGTILGFLVAALLGVSPAAHSQTVAGTFTGTVYAAGGTDANGVINFSEFVGSTISGKFAYDAQSLTPNSIGATSSTWTTYGSRDPMVASATIGGQTYTISATDVSNLTVDADESGISNPANQFNLKVVAGSPTTEALSSLQLVVANNDLGTPYISNLSDPGTVSFTNQSLPASSGQGSELVLYNSEGVGTGVVIFAITSASAAPVQPLTLACPAAAAQAGSPYSSALTAAGGVSPFTFSVSAGSLPSGLTLTPGSGTVVGTASAVGVFTFTAQVTDASGVAAGTVTTSCTITVSPQLSVTPTSLSFGTVPRFSLLLKSVTLKNAGTSPVSISQISITPYAGTSRIDFTPISACRPSLAAGQNCTIYVLFFAADLGSLSATLNIPNNAAGSPQTVRLSATVTPIKQRSNHWNSGALDFSRKLKSEGKSALNTRVLELAAIRTFSEATIRR